MSTPSDPSRPGRRRPHVVIPAPTGPPATGAAPPQAAAPMPRPASGRPASGAKATSGRAKSPKAPKGPRRRRRRRWPKVVAVVVALFLIAGGLALLRAKMIFDDIPRVDVSSAFTPGASGTNILIVGTDSREGVTDDTPNAGAIIGEAVTGARTDSIMVLHQGKDGSQKLLSIPRDLWVVNPATGKKGRINTVYESSPAALVQAVTNLGIPIQRYAEINFVSFSGLVDAVGGITVDFAHPARDTHSGLDVPQAGPVHLDGTQALAYVRSRYYEELIDGKWKTDPTSDLGRAERQRAFLSSLFSEIGSTRNPFALLRIGSSMGSGMRIDDAWSFWTALSMGWKLRGFSPESVALPVSPRTTAGGAAVLDLKPEAGATIAGFVA